MDAARGGEASYAVLARVVNAAFPDIDPPVLRQQVYAWHTRKTLNQAGKPFPAPVREEPVRQRHGTVPRVYFSVAQVLEWVDDGLPPRAEEKGAAGESLAAS